MDRLDLASARQRQVDGATAADRCRGGAGEVESDHGEGDPSGVCGAFARAWIRAEWRSS